MPPIRSESRLRKPELLQKGRDVLNKVDQNKDLIGVGVAGAKAVFDTFTKDKDKPLFERIFNNLQKSRDTYKQSQNILGKGIDSGRHLMTGVENDRNIIF